MISYIPSPSSSSPLSALQGNYAYGNGNPGTVTTITYNFAKAIDSQTWTAAHKAQFKQALAAIEAVANIQFVESFNAATADLVEYIAPSSVLGGPTLLGFHNGPSNSPSVGAFSTDYWAPGVNGGPGGYFFTTLLHELGHALGLGHPHDTGFGTTVMSGVTSPFNVYGTNNLNQGVYTVMSYNDGWTQVNGNLPLYNSYGGSTGLGALDIAALQAMYGANTTHQSGNSTYTLSGANTAGTGYQSIWDTGGIDTIEYLGSSNAVIDLRPATLDYSATGGGMVSYVAGVQGGFTIAAGAVIENATGGSGHDLIVGNTAENVLRGNGGNDQIYSLSNGTNNNTIYAGSGHDVIYLANGSGSDTVYGEAGNDFAIVTNNNGTFYGGSGTDTVRFASAVSNYLFLAGSGFYEIFNVVTRMTFTVWDVEAFEFANGLQSYTVATLSATTAISDIETSGTALQHANHGIYLIGGSSANIAVTYGGQLIGENSLGGWKAVQAESNGAGGYRVLWQNSDGSYSEWNLNGSGQFVSGAVVSNVIDVEVFYGVDLNNDGLTGHGSVNVETNGTALTISTATGYEIGGTPVSLNGVNIGPNSLPGWQAVQAEPDGSGGYRILWKHANGTYVEWSLNGSGQYVGGGAVGNVVDVESFYGADINGDGLTGHGTINVETNGSTTLAVSTTTGYMVAGNQVSLNGTNMGPDSLPGWQAIQAEADGSGGYRILWKNTDGSYSEWTLNGSGQFVSGAAVGNVVDVEVFYGADIDGSGFIGPAPPKLAQLPGASQKVMAPAIASSVLAELEESVDELEFIPNLTCGSNGLNAPMLLDDEILAIAGISPSGDAPGNTIAPDLGDPEDAGVSLVLADLLEDDVFLF